MAKSNRKEMSAVIPQDLELTEGSIRLVSLTFGLTLYTDTLFSKIPDSILGCFDRFLQLCPQDQLHFYATTNMRRHKPVTARTFRMLSTWLKPNAPPRDLIDLEMKGGDEFQDAPTFKFDVCAGEEGSVRYNYKHANLISMAFPAGWGLERTDEMLAFVRELCSSFPFQSGHAGFSFECSRYAKEDSQTHAWEKSMRHRGIDICRVPTDGSAVGQDGLKGVNWLTILSTPIVERLGGRRSLRKSLPNSVEVVDTSGGLILRAGPVPMIGDSNKGEDLPLYKAVYRVIAPLVDVAAERSMSFNLVDDFVERTEAWYRRFSDE